MLVSLTRSGRFHARTMRPNEHKCAAMRTKTYPYEVRLEATDAQLSPEGFLFNNERVQEYFDTRFGEQAPAWDAISCENMALTACRELAGIMLNEGIDVQCVECLIIGSNKAEIRGIWKKNEHIGETKNDTIPQAIAV
jgi:hypothetical protein